MVLSNIYFSYVFKALRMVDMSTLDRVKDLCKSRGISVSILEDKLDIPRNTIYQWRKINPNLERIEAIADYFNVSVDYLLGRTDNTEIQTIAAHHDGDDWTEEELDEIEQFKEFVRMKRKQQE